MSGRLPNFVVVGAPKCGTTSLYYYLRQHPDIFVPERKELHYFAYEYMSRYVAGPGDAYILTTLCATEAEYAAYYETVDERTAVGDVSPSYFYYSTLPGSDLCQRMRDLLGRPRIILMVRDPVEKAFSQYMHLVRDARETLDFQTALEREGERAALGYSAMWRYAESSLFSERVRRFFDEFGRDRVRIVAFDDFIQRPLDTLRGVFEFLGVDPVVPIRLGSAHNRSGTPRSRWVAGLLSRPHGLITVARRVLPVTVTTRVRDLLVRANTGTKPAVGGESRRYLDRYFADDRAALASLLDSTAVVGRTSAPRQR